ncbi:MAG: nicotinate phosphoribosyltransferase [Bacillota bacterium]|jgi:nicotinate phosphoribosyltransferase
MVKQDLQWLDSMEKVSNFKVEADRKLYSATHEEILSGATTDIYFVKAQEILRHLEKEDSVVVAEIFSRKSGMFAGINEMMGLLKDKDVEVWAKPEGSHMEPKDVMVRIKGKYSEFGIYETALLGILASSSGWATAAHKIKSVCPDKMMSVFGARHLHPAVAPVMERAAIVGGIDASSCILGAKLCGLEPAGTTPHAMFLVAGSTVVGAVAYDELMPEDAARIILVDTFKDEIEESLAVAEALGDKLEGIRLDTPSERGGVTIGLVKETRARLDQAGCENVKIVVSGGLTPERVAELAAAGADSFGVGSYISGARALDMTMDIKEVNGKPVAKRGRIPGITSTEGLVKMQ